VSVSEARRLLATAENGSFADTLRAVLKRHFRGRRLGIKEAAKLADLSVRSMQRKLALDDVVFNDLVDETCAELAVEMLRDADVSLDEIAIALGYSTSSNFARAFERWTGQTPTEFRRTM
jgi:AraC-like DNA-binding protein